MKLYTIGHSNHSLETFINLLKKHNINAVADVRSHPYSKYSPHFNKKNLEIELANVDIQYVFLGAELGARPNNPSCYLKGKARYEKIANTDFFNQGIKRVLKGIKKYQITLMCAEHDPIVCHRSILICQHLRKFDIDIYHIKKDGTLETHEQLEERLLELHQLVNNGLVQLSLFDNNNLNTSESKQDLINKAYNIQGDRIAYVDKQYQNYYDNNE